MPKIISINKRSFDQQAADWIRNAVMSGDILPGAKVTELALAEQIGLSRSTVRAAMQRLAREGLLVQHAYSGWAVTSLTLEDAWELYTLRCGFEGLASKLAAERLDDVGRQTLISALEELSSAVKERDRRRVATADIGLHRTIVDLAKHRRLAMMHAQIIDPIQLYVLSTNHESFEDIIPMHEQLVETILRGDATNAQRLASEHVMVSEQLTRRIQHIEKHQKN